MAVTHWYTGRATETTATVVVRANTDEIVTVATAGQSHVVSCATATDDGCAVATFTGLAPGTRYPYTINGSPGGELRTAPSGPPFWIALSSCWSPGKNDALAIKLLTQRTVGAGCALHNEMVNGLCAFVALGDLTYMNRTGTVSGYALVNIEGGDLATVKDVEQRRQYYRATRLNPGLVTLIRNVPTYQNKDDHEYDPNNACYDLAWFQTNFPSATQQDLDDMWTAADTAWNEWTRGNPPSELAGPSVYRVRLGALEMFCTDQIFGRTYHDAVDDANKYMMSAAQEEWLLAAFAASTATFKVFCSTKQFISSCGFNNDGWDVVGSTGKGYKTQLGRIFKDPRFPSAGALSVTGDEHIRSDMFVPAGYFGGSHPGISQISAGPATVSPITDPEDGPVYRSGVRDKERVWGGAAESEGYAAVGENNYVLLRVLADRVERYILGSRYGLRYMGYVGTADNVVRR